MRHTPARRRLAWTLVLITWFVQLCLPVAHAALMATPAGLSGAWCGNPANAAEAVASLPAEVRQALDLEVPAADHLASCVKLCASLSKLPPLPVLPAPALPVAADTPHGPVQWPVSPARQHALPPPSHGPPARA